MRGLASLVLLQQLEQRTGRRIHSLFDLIVGVSTGGILAVCLGLLRLSVAETRQIYLDMSQVVFANKLSLVQNGFFFAPEPLEAFMQKRLGNALMREFVPRQGDMPHVVLLATSIEMLPPSTVLFQNFGQDGDNVYSSVPAHIAVRASSAAPTYFPAKSWNNRIFADGGLGSNNPTIIGLKVSQKLWGLLSVGLVCSVGTGKSPSRRNMSLPAGEVARSISDSIDADSSSFMQLVKSAVRVASNVAPIASLFEVVAEIATSTENNDAVDLLFEARPEIRYFRFNPSLEAECALDCIHLPTLLALEKCMYDHVIAEEAISFATCVSILSQ